MTNQSDGKGVSFVWGVVLTVAVIGGVAWYGGFLDDLRPSASTSPRASSTPIASSTRHDAAWQAACKKVRSQLVNPVGAEFPDTPAQVANLEYANISGEFSSIALELSIGGIDYLISKEKYLEWREPIYDRAKLLCDGNEWVATGWVDTQNRRGSKIRKWWVVLISRDTGTGEYSSVNCQLTDWLD
jgi:hypothetical protein